MDAPRYPASWVDRLIDRIAALPGPSWVAYAIVAVVVFVTIHAAVWLEGVVAPGDVDLYLGSLAIYVIASVGFIHALDHRAVRAWRTFRPATALTDEEAERVEFELTTLPARAAVGWTIGGVVVAALTLVGYYGAPLDLEGEPITFVLTTLVTAFAYGSGGVLLYHTFRQLRLISRSADHLDRVDLLDTRRLHALSAVTAATGVLFVVAAYFSVVTDPATFTNAAVAAVNGSILILAVACFVLPLSGMQRRIAAEKAARYSSVSGRLDAALRDLARRNEVGDLTDADAVHSNLTSLIAERDLIAHTPTWPWSTAALRGFSTAVLLPIVLWLVFRVLEQVLA